MVMNKKSLCGLVLVFAAVVLPAQDIEESIPVMRIEPPQCLPNRGHAPVTLQLDSDDNVSAVRLYFRRLNPVGSFYYVEMSRVGNAVYGTLFPAPADRAQQPLDDSWWAGITSRDWLDERGRSWFEEWLSNQEHEAAEFFFTVTDVYGDRIAQSVARLVEVKDLQDCRVELTPREQEWTRGIAIGETMEAQQNLPPFHWTCEGITDRISIDGRIRPDRSCSTGGSGG